ncbi:MAG: sulfatase/phosphatase domain-containing protein, partial [Nitrospirota bacterium]
MAPIHPSLRVPFIIRWPGKIPPKQVSNEIVHAVDPFPTLASWVGGKVPKDRTIDGADQSDFMMGKTEKSARESVMIYIGNEFFGVKWRNWKMLLKDLDKETYTIRTKAYPFF